MTTAELAPVSGNATAVFFTMTVLTAFVLGAILWRAETAIDHLIDARDEQAAQIAALSAGLEALTAHLGLQILPPIADDSPAAMDLTAPLDLLDPDADTDEFPTVPSTVPDGMPLAVQSALIEQRPTPAPRNIAEPEPVFVERRVNIGGTVQTFRIRAPEGRAK